MTGIFGNSSKSASISGNSPFKEAVGIDDLAVYIPQLYLPLEGEFSRRREIDPGKLT
ncbi:MAG: hydroxymethylglutaryl-CoA synthase, partial [Euryarchaeota archaeon]|nr:hydroxymethylglutaryl-CoA synthase [Euryarchaeota archaeon]